ncbi:type II secretion system protein [bacterium]|nr:type II secretion system protein [bacterium]
MKNLKTLVESQFPLLGRGLGRGGDKKSAFTLAEVLITLGVIGVVASITISALVKHYQKITWTNQLKTNYSLLNQGFQKMMADDGVQNIGDTEVWLSIPQVRRPWGTIEPFMDSSSDIEICTTFYNNLGKYFQISKIGKLSNYEYKRITGSSLGIYNNEAIILNNGAIIFNYEFRMPEIPSMEYCKQVHQLGGHMCAYSGIFDIDINGQKGPNILGRDIFHFYISELGIIIPDGGNDYAIYRQCSYRNCDPSELGIWKTNNSEYEFSLCDSKGRDSSNQAHPNGYGCSGLLIDQLNWKMNY